MLSTFSGMNYKAFESFELNLKPLTVLLGANSCGKSALINSLLMLAQTIDSSSLTESALRLNGPRVGLGESLNVIKDKSSDNILTFSFDFDNNSLSKHIVDSFKREMVDSLVMLSRYIVHIIRSDNSKYKDIPSFTKKMDVIIVDIDNIVVRAESFNSALLKSISESICSLLKLYRENKGVISQARKVPKAILDMADICPIKRIQDCLLGLITLSANKVAAKKITYNLKFERSSKTIKVKDVCIFNKSDEVVLKLDFDKNGLKISSGIIEPSILRGSRSDILKLANPSSLFIFNLERSRGLLSFFNDTANPVAAYISRLVSACTHQLSQSFDGNSINHVSPLRAFPQRYYLLDKTIHHTQLNSLDGTELAEILKKNPKIKDSINLLLAEFNLAVDIDKVNDIIHKIVINQDAVDLELTDVGFGISQVLPVLVQAFLSPKKSITILEQPEIHLHPKMQAWLTDAIIKIALQEDKVFVIETHSDALVRRIRLRIVDENSALTTDHVAIYHLERNREKSSTSLNKVDINSEGDIKWPSEFMDVEIQDTLQIQYNKVQKILKAKKGAH